MGKIGIILTVTALALGLSCDNPAYEQEQPPFYIELYINAYGYIGEGGTIFLDRETLEREITIMTWAEESGRLEAMHCYIDTTLLGTRTAPPFKWTWHTTEADTGDHTIQLVAVGSGDQERETSAQVTILMPTTAYFVVTSVDDGYDWNIGDGECVAYNGECTLRAAIQEANAIAGLDTITFNIPGAGPHTIRPNFALPPITDPVVIDGTTEPDFAGTPVIELDGRNAGETAGLAIEAGSSIVKGLTVNRFRHSGIDLIGSGSNRIEACFIGTDVTGTIPLGNGEDGVFVLDASNNFVGGTTAGSRNIISGNGGNGVSFIGGATGNRVQGNFIGTDVTGTRVLGNGNAGVMLGAPDNFVGGTTPAARNIISGNLEGITFPDDPNATGNQVQGNYIGTDLTGTASVPNGHGILILTAGNTIGGTVEGAGNLISGNTYFGIVLELVSPPVSENTIQGNLIGTDVTGTKALGNSAGIIINGGSDNTIVGLTAGAGNVIAFNKTDGINITPGTGNAILSNSIFDNSAASAYGLGIELNNDGPTLNDPGDADTGPNNLQNYPNITWAAINGSGELIIAYSIDSDVSHSAYPLTVQFFISDGSGEGKTLLGEDSYTATDYQTGTKSVNLGQATAIGYTASDAMVATATDNEGNTSEFSLRFPL